MKLPPATYPTLTTCPDGGACTHRCQEDCTRVSIAGPLSGVFEDDRWPATVISEPACGHKLHIEKDGHRFCRTCGRGLSDGAPDWINADASPGRLELLQEIVRRKGEEAKAGHEAWVKRQAEGHMDPEDLNLSNGLDEISVKDLRNLATDCHAELCKRESSAECISPIDPHAISISAWLASDHPQCSSPVLMRVTAKVLQHLADLAKRNAWKAEQAELDRLQLELEFEKGKGEKKGTPPNACPQDGCDTEIDVPAGTLDGSEFTCQSCGVACSMVVFEGGLWKLVAYEKDEDRE